MLPEKDKRIDGEYDPPLPQRIAKPSEEDKAKLNEIINKYWQMTQKK